MIAVTDEIYEHIVYDGRPHVRWPRSRECGSSVTIGGMSKTYAVTGWRVGTIIAAPRLTHAFRQVHDFVSIGAAAPLQEAGATRIGFLGRITAGSPPIIRRGATVLRSRSVKPASTSAPEGAYYIMAGIAAFGATDDVEFSPVPGA